MTKLSITIHSTDDPIWALAKLIYGKEPETLAKIRDDLFKQNQLTFTENGNPIVTIELIPESWKV